MRPLRAPAFLLMLFLSSRAAAATFTVSSSKLLFTGSDAFFGYLQTAAPQLWDLLYVDNTLGSSHVVFNYDGNTFDMQDTVDPSDVVIAMHAVGSGLGAYVEGVKKQGNLSFGQRFIIANNPRTGVQPDTIEYLLWITNNGPVSAQVGARLLLDVQLIDASHDNAFISVNNGISALSVNTIYRANSTGVPIDWWDYDSDPNVTPPQLTGRGVTAVNPYGDPATPPDAMEAVHWDEVEANDTWDPSPDMGKAFASYSRPDTCVVLWWTGSGQEGDSSTVPSLVLAPGATMQFVAYYGLNQGLLLASPTPHVTPSATFSVSPTYSVSPTISPTNSISPTFTRSPTFSVSPTQSPTFSISPTFSPSPTFSKTLTPCPTATASTSPTRTTSPTISPTVTNTPEALALSPKPANPNPSNGQGVYLPYVLTCPATVRIKVYTVSGELVRALDPYDAVQGANEEFWDEKNSSGLRVATGVFIYRIEARAGADVKSAFRKLAVLR
jgi:hypothetical protein